MQIKKKWRNTVLFAAAIRSLTVALFLVLAGSVVFNLDLNTEFTLAVPIIFILFMGIYVITGGWKLISDKEVSRFLNRNCPELQDSSEIFFKKYRTDLEQLQYNKIASRLNTIEIELSHKPIKDAVFFAIPTLLVTSLFFLLSDLQPEMKSNVLVKKENIYLQEVDSSNGLLYFTDITLAITAPRYMNKTVVQSKELKGAFNKNSKLLWQIGLSDKAVVIVENESGSVLAKSESIDVVHQLTMTLKESVIYRIRAARRDTILTTTYFLIEAIPDRPPNFTIYQPTEVKTEIEFEKDYLNVEALINDDFGINNISLEATLARGQRENITFRQRNLPIENVDGIGTRKVKINTRIDIKKLEMKPGDELYFNLMAEDNKYPNQNRTRSDVYFVIMRDTAQNSNMIVNNIAIDLIPEYFRSQRQIIIDTEKLIENKGFMSNRLFKQNSHSIGVDQYLLRLRYGEYLGLEDKGGMITQAAATTPTVDPALTTPNDFHDDDHDEPLTEVGLTEAVSQARAVIPKGFLHDHGSPEMNTLYADSPKALLKQALDNMWQAELYLRLFEPEKSLPYEFKALDLLKRVQQANRQYKRKAGIQPPPIPVDEKRLSGEFDDFYTNRYFGEVSAELSQLKKYISLATMELTTINREKENQIDSLSQFISSLEITQVKRLKLANVLNRISKKESLDDEKLVMKELLMLLQSIENEMSKPVSFRAYMLPESSENVKP